ncbi:MAG TPA: FAD-dependent oxidoreductase [Steroidobacteraceae bacterium]|nr:FAD-dependent oxidoreductase [Steroidobacteraceae bacterium]
MARSHTLRGQAGAPSPCAHYDALIVGAGPAGSAAAILLAQRGWSVALIERERFPRRKVCGECVSASNLPLLQALGVAEPFRALAGAPLQRIAVWADRRTISAPLPPLPDSDEPYGRALGRERLDALLLARARALGVTIWQPCCAQRLYGRAGAWLCELRSGRGGGASFTLSAAVAIDAHGSSRGSACVAGRRGRRGRELLGFKANYAGARLADDLLPVLCFPGGYGGLVLAGGQLATLACCIRADRLQRFRAGRSLPAGAAVECYLRMHCAPLAAALAGAERRGAWLAMGALQPGIHLDAAHCGPLGAGAFRVGNAAGEAHPIIGEGISMALQSAALLSQLLLACPSVFESSPSAESAQRALAARYASEWRRRFGPRLRWAAWLAYAAMRPVLTRTLVPLLGRHPALLTRWAHRSGKVEPLELPAAIAFQDAAGSTSTAAPKAHSPPPMQSIAQRGICHDDDARATHAHPGR